MHHEKNLLEEIKEQVEAGLVVVGLPKLKAELIGLEKDMESPGFWDDSDSAQEKSKQAAALRDEVERWEQISKDVDELLALLPLIHPEEAPEEAAEFRVLLADLEQRWKQLNVATFLNEKFDKKSAILTVYCGLGGKDAQDFASMLQRMYMRFADHEGFLVQILDEAIGDEVGIKQVTMQITGLYAFGYLKHEQGIHRLIRLSPFNSGNTRETSFAKVEVIPKLDFSDHVEIIASDLRVDTYRASGAGGQHVNTTDSAVRITHIPTGLVVQCQNERSQLQNKESAMAILQGRLQKLMHEQQLEKLDELKGEKTDMAWGHQIRTYTLHPYSLAKDHRTNYEEKNADKVLDGNLGGFIEANLQFFSTLER